MPFVILSVGRDLGLLKARNAALSAAGYLVVPAYSPKEGLEKVVEGDFDLVLLCASLGDGASALTSAIRRYSPSIPVVAIGEQDRDRSHNYGTTHSVARGSDEIAFAIAEILANEHMKHISKPMIAGANVVKRS